MPLSFAHLYLDISKAISNLTKKQYRHNLHVIVEILFRNSEGLINLYL